MLSPERKICQLYDNALGTTDVTHTLFCMIMYLLLQPFTNTPVVGALDSSPNPWDSFLLLQTFPNTNVSVYFARTVWFVTV